MDLFTVLIVNFLFGLPFFGFLGAAIHTSYLQKICTYPVKARIKEIKFRTVTHTHIDQNSGSASTEHETEYYEVLEFDHYGGTHTVRGHSAKKYTSLGKEGDIVELLIDPNNGDKYIFKNSNNMPVLIILSVIFGVMFVAANVIMIVLSHSTH